MPHYFQLQIAHPLLRTGDGTTGINRRSDGAATFIANARRHTARTARFVVARTLLLFLVLLLLFVVFVVFLLILNLNLILVIICILISICILIIGSSLGIRARGRSGQPRHRATDPRDCVIAAAQVSVERPV